MPKIFMSRGIIMRTIRYMKPNMTNLKGKKGRAIIEEIRNAEIKSMDDIKRDADACMNRILARRNNAKEVLDLQNKITGM